MSKRYYTLDEVNRAIPGLQASFARVMQLRTNLKSLYQQLERRGFAPEGDDFDIAPAGASPEVVRDRANFLGLLETLREELEAVRAAGCVIKDVESGLVDWTAQRERDGREILLCWRFGEKEVAYWHDVDAGFAGRRPVSEL